MKNKTISQAWFTVLALAFCYGFYCATVGTEPGGVVMGILKLSSIVLTFWGMVKLWMSKE